MRSSSFNLLGGPVIWEISPLTLTIEVYIASQNSDILPEGFP